MFNKSRLFAAVGLTAALSLSLSACGGEADTTDETTAPAETTTAAESTTEETETSAPAEEMEEIVIALVPSGNADTIMGTAEPMVEYLSKELGTKVSSVVTQDYTGAVEAIGANQAQVAFLPPLPMEQAVSRKGAVPLLQVVRYGSATYHSQFMTNDPDTYCDDKPEADKDGNLFCNGTMDVKEGPAALDALKKIEKGTKVAFVEESSTSGYIFPMLDFINAGMSKDDVEAQFTGGHDKAVLAVYNGQAPVGVSFDDARGIVKDKDDVGEKVVVFALSEEIPNDGVVASKSVSEEMQGKIKQALIDYVGTTDGAKVMDELYEITEFADADVEALKVVTQAAEKVIGE